MLAQELDEILNGQRGEQAQVIRRRWKREVELSAAELEAILDRSDEAFARTDWSTDTVQIAL